MPAYPIPPWLHGPPDPGEEFTRAASAGASIAEAQARLQQSAVQAGMEMDVRKQQLQQEQQRIEITRQMHQLQAGLLKQRLDQQNQLIQARTQQAAMQLQAQGDFTKERDRLLALGTNAEDATNQAIMKVGPRLGANAAQFYKATLPDQPFDPSRIHTTPQGHEFYAGPHGNIQVFGQAQAGGTMSQADNKLLADLEKQRTEAEKAEITPWQAKAAARPGESLLEAGARLKEENVNKIQGRIDDLYRKYSATGYGPQAAPPATAPAAPAAPGRKVITRDSSGRLVVSQAGAQAAPAAAPGAPPPPEAPVAAPPSRPAPQISVDDFNAAIRRSDVSNPYKALENLGANIAKEVGFPAQHPKLQYGSSTFFKDVGKVFYEAIQDGKSKEFPWITRKVVNDYLNSLPPEKRSQILWKAMEDTPGLPLPEQAPPARLSAPAPAPTEAAGFE